jgi:hypothetical protein
MTIQTQFQKFLSDIEPSPTAKAEASSAHTTLRKFLREHSDFKHFHVETFLSGSYRRNTAIRPRIINGRETRPDIDIIVVTNHTVYDNPADVLGLLRDTLGEKYALSDPPQQRSLGVFTKTVEMDVVPIIAPGGLDGMLYLPDKKLETWLVTNPPRHTAWTEEINKATEQRFKPLVKLIKWWRRENPTISKRPKGFVLECIVAECMNRTETQYVELFLGTLESIIRKYSMWVALRLVPFIYDPGVPGNSVTNGISLSAFEGFYKKVKAHAELGRQAQNEPDEEKSIRMWREIFGERFPAPSGRQATSLLTAAVAPRGLTFPNWPVVPRKPSGFAT